jgi:acyl-CoA thioesterase I
MRWRSRREWLAHCSLLCVLWPLATRPALAAAAASPASGAPAKSGAARRAPVLLVVGDSLSAEYGLIRGSGWVALLERRLASDKRAATVVNASISGETTSGGRSRLPALLEQHRPSHVLIELGGNDALRGLPLAMTRDNLVSMTRAARAAGAKVLLVGMQVPPNYGRSYGQEFQGLFAAVAQAEGAALVPQLLAGVADSPQADRLFQPDRIHPTAEAQPTLLGNVWPVLSPWLR